MQVAGGIHMEVHGEEKYRQSPSEVNTPGAQNITISWSTLDRSSNDSETHVSTNVSRAPFPHITLLLRRRKEFPFLVRARKARWYREDPGVRETRVSAPYSPACVLLFCRPKICEGHKNVCLYSDDIMRSSRTCRRR